MIVTRLRHTCPACADLLHDRCWAWLAELFGGAVLACPCQCRDEHGDLTEKAIREMAARHPYELARMIRVRDAFRRGSWGLHARLRRYTWPAGGS